MQDRKKRTRGLLVLVATALVGWTVTAGAYGPGAGECGGGPDRLAALEQRVQGLDLDDTTRTAVFAILDGARDSTRDLQAQLRSEMLRMRELLAQSSPEEAAVLAQVDQISATMTSLRKHQVRTLLAVFSQLTPEQRTRLRPDHGPSPHRGRPGRAG